MKRDPELFPIWWIYALLAIILLAVFGCESLPKSETPADARHLGDIFIDGYVSRIAAVRDTTAGVICYVVVPRGGVSCLYDEVAP